MKLSTQEPAERTITAALSPAEVAALANWHIARARKIPAAAGKAAMEMRSKSLLWSSRRHSELFKVAEQQLEAHTKRAQELILLIPKP